MELEWSFEKIDGVGVELELKFLIRYGVGVELEWLTPGVAHLCTRSLINEKTRDEMLLLIFITRIINKRTEEILFG